MRNESERGRLANALFFGYFCKNRAKTDLLQNLQKVKVQAAPL